MTGLIVAIIQLSNCYLVIKYIYISIYALLEHHRFVRKIEDKIRRKWPRFAAIVCKIRTNSILVSMRWSIVKKLIISGRIFTLKSRSNEFYNSNNNNTNLQSIFSGEKSFIDGKYKQHQIKKNDFYNKLLLFIFFLHIFSKMNLFNIKALKINNTDS